MTHYIHNLNPVLLELPGPLAIRWYSISYLLGFAFAVLLLKHWSKKRQFQVPQYEVSNFIVLMALFGVLLGGRLGYVLLYGLDHLLSDPLYFFRVWEGGMASHGGILGVILFILWYAHKHKHSFWNLIDHMACVAPFGIALGRLANFINGELWGRVTEVKWGVIFPQVIGLTYGHYTPSQITPYIDTGILHPRHPSQLYQAACEGFMLFFILLLIRRTSWGKRDGAMSVCFLILYAVARIAMEFFREPDEGQAIFWGWMTKGQLYSLSMFFIAAIILFRKKLFYRNAQ